jgi:hypothetical protein
METLLISEQVHSMHFSATASRVGRALGAIPYPVLRGSPGKREINDSFINPANFADKAIEYGFPVSA